MNYNIFTGQVPLKDQKNAPWHSDRRCALLAASALFIFGSFAGCAIYRVLGIGESELYDNLIERYFLALFMGCESTLDVIRVAADCCLNEVWMFIAVYLSGFTLFVPVICGALLLYRGVLFGFSLTMLQFSSRTGLLLDSIVYLFSGFALAMLLSLLSAEAVCHYYKNRHTALTLTASKRYTLTFLRIFALAAANVILMLFLIYVYI